jgi:hypothetical protein
MYHKYYQSADLTDTSLDVRYGGSTHLEAEVGQLYFALVLGASDPSTCMWHSLD